MTKRVEIDVAMWPEVRHFADSFREARRKAGVTQKELEKITGLTQAYISGVESYYANPSLQTMAMMCRAINVSLASCMPDKPSGKPPSAITGRTPSN